MMAATVLVATDGPFVSRPASSRRGFGFQEDGGGVDLVALGPEPAGPIGPAQTLRREVQLRCGDEQRLPGGQVGGALGHGNPIVRRGEADTVELAMDFSQDVGPGEGGPSLRDLADRDRCCVGEDLVGQVTGSEQRQVVAVGEASHPRVQLTSDVVLGSLAPPFGHHAEGAVLFDRPGLECRLLAQLDDLHRGGLTPMGGDERGNQHFLALLDGSGPLRELGHQGLGNPGHLPADLVGMTP